MLVRMFTFTAAASLNNIYIYSPKVLKPTGILTEACLIHLNETEYVTVNVLLHIRTSLIQHILVFPSARD